MVQIRPLNQQLAKIAEEQLGEDEKNLGEQIATFRKWIERHPYLRARTDDQFLIAFLRFAHFDMEKAKVRIEFYYSYKTVIAPELWRSRRLDETLFSIGRAGIFATLPKPAGLGGPRIHLTMMGKIDTSLFSVQEMFRFQLFRSEIEINEDDNWNISGVLEIIDMKRMPYSLLRQYDSKLFSKMAANLEYGIPTNLIGTHIVNASREAQLVLMLVRTVMKEKHLLHIHSSIESLQKAIGKEYLPAEYEGENGSVEEASEQFLEKLESYRDYFNQEEQYGVDADARAECQAQESCVQQPSEALNFS